MEGFEALPSELWDHILSFLVLPSEAALAALTCRSFHNLVTANPRLLALLTLPRFVEANNVTIDENGRRALVLGPSSGFPTTKENTAYVQSSTTVPAMVVHFSLEQAPGTYFCVSVAAPDEKPSPTKSTSTPPQPYVSFPTFYRKEYFMASYYSDGDIHSYGSLAPYRRELRPAATFKRGDIISVQMGMRDLRTASPHAPGWADGVIDIRTVLGYGFQEHEVHPYLIYFKNFEMVHLPLVFPHLGGSEWPRLGLFFATSGEEVRIIAPPAGQRFQPLLPHTA